MRNKGDEEFYNRLSRKELQCLCKKYGLPANKSSSEMAKSLSSYFEKNLISASSGESLGGIREVSLPTITIPGLQPGAPFNSLEDPGEDGHGMNSCFREEGNGRKYSQSGNKLGHCMGDKTHDEEGLGCSMCCLPETSNSQFPSQYGRSDFNSHESPATILCKDYSGFARDGGVEDMCPIQHTDINFGSCSKEIVLPSSTKTFKADSSSFEFYVHSEEGIDLCVDLNSSPSDWIKKLKSEVNICENMCHNKSPSFHKELGRFGESSKEIKSSFLWNIDADQVKDSHVQSGSSPSMFTIENQNALFNHPDGGDGSLTCIPIKPSSVAVVGSENLQEDQGLISSEPGSDVRDCTRSCTDENGCTTTLDSDVNTPGKILSSDSVNISDSPKILATMKHQNSKPSNEICEYPTLKNNCSLAKSQAVFAGSLTSGSMEMPLLEAEIQQKDASRMPCKDGEFLDLVDSVDNTETEQSALANSSEPDIDIGRNHLRTSVEEWERHRLIDGAESSECSQLDDSLGKTCIRLDDVECNEEPKRKRPLIDSVDQNGHGKPDAKTLRSTKQFSGKVLPRRSTRLVSK